MQQNIVASLAIAVLAACGGSNGAPPPASITRQAAPIAASAAAPFVAGSSADRTGWTAALDEARSFAVQVKTNEFACEHHDGEGDARLNATTTAALAAHDRAVAALEAAAAAPATTQAAGDLAAATLRRAQAAAKVACTASQDAIAAERADGHEAEAAAAPAASSGLVGRYTRSADGYDGTIEIKAPNPKDFTKTPVITLDGRKQKVIASAADRVVVAFECSSEDGEDLIGQATMQQTSSGLEYKLGAKAKNNKPWACVGDFDLQFGAWQRR